MAPLSTRKAMYALKMSNEGAVGGEGGRPGGGSNGADAAQLGPRSGSRTMRPQLHAAEAGTALQHQQLACTHRYDRYRLAAAPSVLQLGDGGCCTPDNAPAAGGGWSGHPRACALDNSMCADCQP